MTKQKQTVGYKFRHNSVYRCKIYLLISMIWTLCQCLYNLAVGLCKDEHDYIWWFGIAAWFCILFFFKLALLVNCNRMFRKQKHASFKVLTIVYLFINCNLIWAITITPSFITNVFMDKINEVNIVSIILNLISCGIFFSSWLPVKKEGLTVDEYSFIKCREYVGRSEGFFTILLVTLNIIIIIRDYTNLAIQPEVITYVYLGIGCVCAAYSFALAIWLCKTKRFNIKK